MRRENLARILLCLAAAGVALGSVSGETLNLAPVADTGLLEAQPDFNLGKMEDVPVGSLGPAAGKTRGRMLLRFDLATAVPSDAVIQGALLRLSVTRTPDGGGVGSAFGLYRVLRSWVEGTGRGGLPGGSRAGAGEVTWLSAAHPSSVWRVPGGEAGVDYAVEPSSTERVGAVGRYEFEFGPDQLAELQQWIVHPESNFGWVLISRAEETAFTARRFATREHPQADLQPTLMLEVSGAGAIPAPVIRSVAWQGGEARVVVAVEPGIGYALESKDRLAEGLWVARTENVTTNRPGDLVLVDGSATGSERFFRVRATR